MRRSLPGATLVALTCAALALSACGETTVESTQAPEKPTASESATAESSATESSTTRSSATESSAAGSSAATVASASNGSAQQPEQPAREVTSVPETGGSFSPAEEKFFDALRNKGVNVDGVEAQVAATGFSVCDGTTFTRDAVAGQLVEQRRTDLDPAATAELIDATAHDHLC
ncbi:hypothetical protein [Corynebacterium mayonis]|uniref:hypothetical protein n=1 Tax=Corynebacterium mayonis TaxID=3062461 RepID=UPI003140B57E